MGMFDSFYDAKGGQWQTKAMACLLDRYDLGDEVPGPPIDYQMEVIGDGDGGYRMSFATIRAGRLSDLPCDRDQTIPVLAYSSGWGDEFLTPAEPLVNRLADALEAEENRAVQWGFEPRVEYLETPG